MYLAELLVMNEYGPVMYKIRNMRIKMPIASLKISWRARDSVKGRAVGAGD